jgi:glutathione S-transferase
MPKPLTHHAAVASSVAAMPFTGGRGSLVVKAAAQPEKPIVLYDMEGCPYCRIAREAASALHLDLEIRPCPKGGTRFRPEVERLGGKQQFPYLVDENTGARMYESRDIVEHLFREYGEMEVPKAYRAGRITPLTSGLVTLARTGRGLRARPSRTAEEPLELTSFEGSPYSRLVRERLTELELPYTLRNLAKEHWKEIGPAVRRIAPNPYVPREGGKRFAFHQKHGRVQVPYLEDPDTGAALFESAAIIDYLERTYAL